MDGTILRSIATRRSSVVEQFPIFIDSNSVVEQPPNIDLEKRRGPCRVEDDRAFMLRDNGYAGVREKHLAPVHPICFAGLRERRQTFLFTQRTCGKARNHAKAEKCGFLDSIWPEFRFGESLEPRCGAFDDCCPPLPDQAPSVQQKPEFTLIRKLS
jgi:hypothetical protein